MKINHFYQILNNFLFSLTFYENELFHNYFRAELDAFFIKLYGLTEEELYSILDPQDVFGPDFRGETFRVLKKKEIRQFGKYRTKRLVLEAWKKHNQYGKGEIICTLLK